MTARGRGWSLAAHWRYRALSVGRKARRSSGGAPIAVAAQRRELGRRVSRDSRSRRSPPGRRLAALADADARRLAGRAHDRHRVDAHPGQSRRPGPGALVQHLHPHARRTAAAAGAAAGVHRPDLAALLDRPDARRPLPVVAAHAVVGRRLRRAAPRGRGEAARGRGAARSAVGPGIRRGVGQRGAAAGGGAHGRRFGGAAVSRAGAARPGNRGLRRRAARRATVLRGYRTRRGVRAFFDRVLAK